MVSRMHRTLQHTRDMYNPLVSHESLHPGITVRPQILAGLVSYLSFSLPSILCLIILRSQNMGYRWRR